MGIANSFQCGWKKKDGKKETRIRDRLKKQEINQGIYSNPYSPLGRRPTPPLSLHTTNTSVWTCVYVRDALLDSCN
jgi:hypothetical protein